MFTHKQVWAAIDTIADRYGFSASGLAKKSGLDPTSFNPSKRHGPDGRPRWPTTESIARVLGVEAMKDGPHQRKGELCKCHGMTSDGKWWMPSRKGNGLVHRALPVGIVP